MNLQFYPLKISEDWALAKQRIDLLLVEDSKGIVAKNENMEIQAMAIFDTWTHNSVQVHMIIENPMVLRHGFLTEIADYVFYTCERGILYGLVPSNNEKALKLDKHIGFSEICRLKDAVMKGIDMVILELRKEDCRWLSHG